MYLVLNSAPAAKPVTVAEIKTHLRISHTADDSYLTAVAAAVADWIEGPAGHLRRAVVTQSWFARMAGFPLADRIRIPIPPLQAVQAVTYYDATNTLQTLSPSLYHVISPYGGAGGLILASTASWPATYDRPDAVSIEFTAGYGAASAVPGPIKQAALLIAGDLYANRGDDPAALVKAEAMKSANIAAAEALLSRYIWREMA